MIIAVICIVVFILLICATSPEGRQRAGGKCTCFQMEGDGPYYLCVSGCEKCPVCNPPKPEFPEFKKRNPCPMCNGDLPSFEHFTRGYQGTTYNFMLRKCVDCSHSWTEEVK